MIQTERADGEMRKGDNMWKEPSATLLRSTAMEGVREGRYIQHGPALHAGNLSRICTNPPSHMLIKGRRECTHTGKVDPECCCCCFLPFVGRAPCLLRDSSFPPWSLIPSRIYTLNFISPPTYRMPNTKGTAHRTAPTQTSVNKPPPTKRHRNIRAAVAIRGPRKMTQRPCRGAVENGRAGLASSRRLSSL